MSSTLGARQFSKYSDDEEDQVLVCPLCHDTWDDPVELQPCGDIFCRACLQAARKAHHDHPSQLENFCCPTCSTVVQNEKAPNRLLVNAALMVKVQCKYCTWSGTREESSKHKCAKPPQQHASAPSKTKKTSSGELPTPKKKSNNSSTTTVPTAPSFTPMKKAMAVTPNTSLTGAGGSGSSPPLRMQRESDDGTDSALMRNFRPIGDDPEPYVRPGAAPTAAWSGGGYEAAPLSASTSADYAGGYEFWPPGGGGGGSPAPPHAPARPAYHPPAQDNTPWLAYNFTQVEYDQMAGIFLSFDVNGTSRLTREEATELFRCLNYVENADDADILFCVMDTSGAGSISLHDFCVWLKNNRPSEAALSGLTFFEYNDALLRFRAFDRGNHNVIDWNSFCTLCMNNRFAQTVAEARSMFASCDTRQCGYVGLHQYLMLVRGIKRNNGGRLP